MRKTFQQARVVQVKGRLVPIILLVMFPSLVSGFEGEGGHGDKVVITAAEIKKMNVRSIVELLNQVPGVSAGDSSVSIRGSYMVRVLLDGRPINDPLSAHRSINWGLVSLENIEKVEIYKGSGAVLFGDDSSGGVISIKTKKISGFKGNIELFRGNLDTESYSLNCRQTMNMVGKKPVEHNASWDVDTSTAPRKLGIGLCAAWYKTAGFRTNGDKDKKRIGTKFSYQPGTNNTFDLSLDYSHEDRGMPGLPAFPTPKARAKYNTFGSSFLSGVGRLKVGTHFSTFEKEHKNPETNLETLLKSWSAGQDLKYPFSVRRCGLINTGLNFEIAGVRGNKIESGQEERYALYASKEIRLKRLPAKLGFGLRCNLYSEYGRAFNPEVRLSVERGAFTLQVSALSTNNTPTFIQRYYESSTTKPNPDLGMEKAMNYSLTLSYQPKKSFQGSVSVFFNKIEDRITYVRGDDGTGRYENLGEVTLKGSELSMKWKPWKSLEIRPSYIYLLARDEETGNWLPCKPKHKIRLDLEYKPLHDLTVTFNTRYVSRQYSRSDNSESVPAYFLANFRADYYLKKLRLFLKIENLFDKDYYYGDGYPAPPRTWITGVSYEF